MRKDIPWLLTDRQTNWGCVRERLYTTIISQSWFEIISSLTWTWCSLQAGLNFVITAINANYWINLRSILQSFGSTECRWIFTIVTHSYMKWFLSTFWTSHKNRRQTPASGKTHVAFDRSNQRKAAIIPRGPDNGSQNEFLMNYLQIWWLWLSKLTLLQIMATSNFKTLILDITIKAIWA